MTTQELSHAATIAAPIEAAQEFIGQVGNLPKWSRFFLGVDDPEGDSFHVRTLIGPARTRIVEQAAGEGNRYTIVSAFGEKTETADILLERHPAGIRITLVLNLPAGLPEERRTMFRTNMEAELETLKERLEVKL